MTDWHSRRLCNLSNAHLFDLPSGVERKFGDGGVARLKAASEICDRCPVSGECVEAIVRLKGEGLAGGLLFENGRRCRIQPHRVAAANDAALLPHGTHAAAMRHRRRGEALCAECRESERRDSHARLVRRRESAA